jgi:purine/pyrimidine-nucleoside phosphorylase
MKTIDNVSLTLKANVYFDGKVVSHGFTTPDGAKKTAGLIYPGAYKFDTGAPERMDVVAGECRVKQAGEKEWKAYGAGTFFKVPGKSFFEIAVDKGIAEYLCSFE